jgi:NADP-dependent 3-hydroxy acid dehydrogenase YdfG
MRSTPRKFGSNMIARFAVCDARRRPFACGLGAASSRMDNHDRVLLITGASSGIGAATAKAAHEAGFQLVLAARSEDKLRELASTLDGAPLTVRCDVTSIEEQRAMVAAALARFGRIDAVFANAGIGGSPGGFAQADPERWKQMILTNVYGLGLTVQVALEALKASRGHLLITGSIAGRRTLKGSMYSATKWAVSAIGYGVREELAGSGVRVTLIEPGMVDTPFFDDPKPQALRPDDVARGVLYALSQPATVDVHELVILPTPQVEAFRSD